MPHFEAPLANYSNIVGNTYVLDVLDPDSLPECPNTIGATVAVDLHSTYISRELAARFGCDQEGDTIKVVIHQWDYQSSRIHEFDPIPLVIQFANPRLGKNYLCIGRDDLEEYFDIYLKQFSEESPEPDCLRFEPAGACSRMCRVL